MRIVQRPCGNLIILHRDCHNAGNVVVVLEYLQDITIGGNLDKKKMRCLCIISHTCLSILSKNKMLIKTRKGIEFTSHGHVVISHGCEQALLKCSVHFYKAISTHCH